MLSRKAIHISVSEDAHSTFRKMCIDHIDNNPLNNHLSNLQILSIKENSIKDRK